MVSTLNYASLQKEVLTRLKEGLLAGEPSENLLNLVDSALDYGFYLIDDPTGINVEVNPLDDMEENK